MEKKALQKRNRGFASTEDIALVHALPLAQQEALFSSANPWERTAAVTALSLEKSVTDTAFAATLLCLLQREPALYTRLCVSEVLQKGNVKTAKLICEYLGQIGSNQLTEPEPPSKKKSYPLPRDLAARILAKMQPDILPALLNVLQGNDLRRIVEAIDAYGFLLFYNRAYATKAQLSIVLQLLQAYPSHELLVYKCTTCLSAFAPNESKVYLEALQIQDNLYIAENAARSLQISQNRAAF